jgi:hypothetical protein
VPVSAESSDHESALRNGIRMWLECLALVEAQGVHERLYAL